MLSALRLPTASMSQLIAPVTWNQRALGRWPACRARSSPSGAGFVPVPEMMAPTRGWLDVLKASLSPYDAGIYLNFAEQRFEITKAFPPETVDRLREVKRRYDPEDVFKSNHPVTG